MDIKQFFIKIKKEWDRDDLSIRMAIFIYISAILTYLIAKFLIDLYGWKFDFLNVVISFLISAVTIIVILVVIDYFWPGPFGQKNVSYFSQFDSFGQLLLWSIALLFVVAPLAILIAVFLRKIGVKGIPYHNYSRPDAD